MAKPDEQEYKQERMARAFSDNRLTWLAFAALAILTSIRLAAILAAKTIPDSDECVVGLMALHMLHGSDYPLYFYGQAYGAGAGIEAAFTSLLFMLTGPSATALKLSGLILNTAVIAATWRVSRTLFGVKTAAVTLLLFAACPTLAEWGMKLRGGHTVSMLFMVAAAAMQAKLLWSREGQTGGQKFVVARFAGLGLLLGLAAWSQPIALAGATALFLTGVVFLSFRKELRPLAAMVAASITIALIHYSLAPGHVAWAHDMSTISAGKIFYSITRVLPAFFSPYLDPVEFNPSVLSTITATAWTLAAVLLFVFAFREAIKAKGEPGRYSSAIPMIIVAATTLSLPIIPDPQPRHLLVALPFVIMLMAKALSLLKKSAAVAIAAVLVLSGISVNAQELANRSFHNPGLGMAMNLDTPRLAIKDLEKNGVHYVFCPWAELTGNILFLSRERILARSLNPHDRYQPYVEEVNRAALEGRPVAVLIPFPHDKLMKPWIEQLDESGTSRKSVVAEDLIILYGVPPETIFSLFPLE